MPFTPPDLDATLRVFAAMITPAVMILATGSLILTTTNRLVRVIDRVREMLPEFEKFAEAALDEHTEQKRKMLFEQLDRATARARLVQRALTRLYVGLGLFLGTSASLGVLALAKWNAAWIPLTLGLAGVGFLLSASLLLIFESRISLAATYAELDYIRRISENHAPPDLRDRQRPWSVFG